jgi:hypothetical protein
MHPKSLALSDVRGNRTGRLNLLFVSLCFAGMFTGHAEEGNPMQSLEQVKSQLAAETADAYRKCPYSFLSRDYFARFNRDKEIIPNGDEMLLGADWKILMPVDAKPLTETMGQHLAEFLTQRMEVDLGVDRVSPEMLASGIERAVVLLDSGGGAPSVPDSFTISVDAQKVTVHGQSAEGLRDGVVKLVDLMGARQAPILSRGEQVYKPRLGVRLGVLPWMGSCRDLVFMGHNAVLLNTYFEGEESLFAISRSDAIPELAVRRKPEVLSALIEAVKEAKRYGLRTYAQVNTRQKFPGDDPVFAAHPDIRGALTWKADGEYVLCSEHPLVQQYLAESVEGIFQSTSLDGLMFINGGESFYHCFMRSYGTAKGHTNCTRCEPLGAETVVAELSNRLLAAARKVNPDAEVIAWPYSAEHVWSADRYQEGLIEKLNPGAGIFTEIEKDESLKKPDGVVKYIGDYSIDLIGPGERAKRQVAACKAAGIPIYIKSEPELGFELPRVPYIPCLDRWADRAEALVSCGADGAWVFPYFRPYYASSSAEVFKSFWWEPVVPKEEILLNLAKRIAGNKAGPHLRNAWKHASEAIDWSPEQPSYYTGPYYLGPAHPMCADPAAELPKVFHGQFLFMGESVDADGLQFRPTFVTSPTGNVPVFGMFYRNMEACLKEAMAELDLAIPLVPEQYRATFDEACSSIRWFYHTARTAANFYESCQLRDTLLKFAEQESRTPETIEQHRVMLVRWEQILHDEKANAEAALPLVEADMRLDCYYGTDHKFSHGADMIRAKLQLLETEIGTVLPDIGQRCGAMP